MDYRSIDIDNEHQLAFAEYGTPGGTPLFFFHGFPGSRLQAAATHQPARALNIHVVSPDRPGFGRSSFVPDRRIMDWPDTIKALADHIGWDRFSVVGVSGGGPYVLACCLRLRERINRAVVVCGVPHHRWLETSSEVRDVLQKAYGVVNRYKPCDYVALGLGKAIVRVLPGPWLIRSLLPVMSRPDREAIIAHDWIGRIARTTSEAFRGPARGLAHDLRLITSDWGFSTADVKMPVRFWHGDRDQVCPLTDMRQILQAMPHHTLTIAKGEGHYSLPLNQAGEILECLR